MSSACESLEPCPFCGARLLKSDELSTRRADTFVHPEPEDAPHRCILASTVIRSDSPERIAAWNTRAAPPQGAGGDVGKLTAEMLAQAFSDTEEHGFPEEETNYATAPPEVKAHFERAAELLKSRLATPSSEGERPQGAGWSTPPKEEAAHAERLSAEELRLTGNALSEWAWDHLSKGYGVCLTVREVSRLIAGVKASATTPTPGSPAIGGEDVARIILFENGMFDSVAEIRANPDHRLVINANRAAARILAALSPQVAAAAPTASS